VGLSTGGRKVPGSQFSKALSAKRKASSGNPVILNAVKDLQNQEQPLSAERRTLNAER